MTLNRSFEGFVGLLLLASPFVLPAEAHAHAHAHQNNGLWMPCAHEAELHRELRRE